MASLLLPNRLSSPQKTTRFSKTHISKSLKSLTNSQNLSKSYHQQISTLCNEGQLHNALSLLNQMESNDIPIGPEMYGELLQGCIYERALFVGKQIHAKIIKNGAYFYKNEYIETKILIFYAKCDCLTTAEDIFLRQSRPPNVFAWAAMIGMHSRNGLNEKALMGFCRMLEMGSYADNFVIPNVLKACSAIQSIGLGKGIHGYVLKLGFGSCVYVLSSLVDFYGKCGLMHAARKMFEEMPERNVVTWNSMLGGFVKNGMDEEALEMFCNMRMQGVEPTRVSIATFLSASANLEVDEGRQGHGLAVSQGLALDSILGTSIINFYCKVGLVEDAEMIFDLMFNRDVVTWNLLVSGYVLDGQIEKALDTCYQMRKENLKFDSVTLASILSACTDSDMKGLGRIGHAYCIRNNLESDMTVISNTIEYYASCGRLEYAQRIFDFTTSRDLVLWNTLISAYAQHGLSGEALKLFYQMQLEGVPPNVISWNSVILGFLQNRQVNEAQEVFSQMQSNGVNPNFITWITFIFGLVQNGCAYGAIQYFVQMQSVGIKPSPISIVGVLLACSNTLSLTYGRTVHAHIMRRGLLSSFPVATSLIDMYAKCGSINLAKRIFELVSHKDLPLYNAMICALSLHGKAKEALALYKHMHGQGMEPDNTTFTWLLSACSHADHVDEGLNVFMEMVCKYLMIPQKEDCISLVALLACGANLKEAFKVVSAMPVNADAHTLESLFAPCQEHQEMELGEYLSSCLLELESTNSMNCTIRSSVYAVLGKWQRASSLRALPKEIAVMNPECSWIPIENELHEFAVADKSHQRIDIVFETLLCLHRQMKFISCAPLKFRPMDTRKEIFYS